MKLQQNFSIKSKKGRVWCKHISPICINPTCVLSDQTLRLKQLPAAPTHFVGMMIPCPPSIMSAREWWMADPRWLTAKLSRPPSEYMLVTSDPEMFGLLPFVSFDEFKVPTSDCKTSELWEALDCICRPRPPVFLCSSLPLLPFPSEEFLVFKNRPPHPLGRRIACRWRDSCIYGCITNTKTSIGVKGANGKKYYFKSSQTLSWGG